jgi:hypothetical protein
MPICQFIVNNNDDASFTSGAITSTTPVTVYKQCLTTGKYKAKIVSINWVDYMPSAVAVANNYIVNVNSNTWRFPFNGSSGFSFTNKPDHIQVFPSEIAPTFEIVNTGANMDIILSVTQFNASGPNTAAFWSDAKFSHLILTLDLEKVPEMV